MYTKIFQSHLAHTPEWVLAHQRGALVLLRYLECSIDHLWTSAPFAPYSGSLFFGCPIPSPRTSDWYMVMSSYARLSFHFIPSSSIVVYGYVFLHQIVSDHLSLI